MYKNPQSRDQANRGRIEGGNSASQEVNVESHESKRATRIPQGSTTGTSRTWHNERGGGGNSAASASQEKHNQPKNKGKHFVGGKLVGPAATDLVPVQCDDRGLDASGNLSKGGREQSGSPKAGRVSGGIDRWH